MQDRASSTRIVPVDTSRRGAAAALLGRFFSEEGFPGDAATIAARLDALLDEPANWAVIALDEDGRPIGVATVTTMLFVEWGRMAEIGDLYVLPEHRERGVARALVRAAADRSRANGCSAVSVVMTPEGQAAHGLPDFYARLGFADSGRKTAIMTFPEIPG